MILLQKHDLASDSFSNSSGATQGVVIRTDAGSTVGLAIAAASSASTVVSMAHAWDPSGNGSGTITLTFADNSTVSCLMSALPQPLTC